MTEPNPPAPSAPAPPPAPAQYAPGPSGAQPYGYTGQLVPRTNTLAIVALILSLTVSLGGIICGHIALSQIKRTGEGGYGLALAGTIIGYVFTGFVLLYLVGMAFVLVASLAAVPYLAS